MRIDVRYVVKMSVKNMALILRKLIILSIFQRVLIIHQIIFLYCVQIIISLIHVLNPKFDYDELQYIYPDGKTDKIILDLHLTHGKEEK